MTFLVTVAHSRRAPWATVRKACGQELVVLVTLHLQSESRQRMYELSLFSYSDRTIPCWWCCPRSGCIFLLQLNLSGNTLMNTKRGGVSMVILNVVNNEDAPAHPGRPWTCSPLISDSLQLALRTWTSGQGRPVSLGGTDRYFLFYLKLSVKAEFFGLHCEMWVLPYQAFQAPRRVTSAESLNF